MPLLRTLWTTFHPPSKTKPVAAARGAAPSKAAFWVLLSLWLVLAVNLCLAVALYQINVLSWDQWDFCAPLFENRSSWDVFNYQHGPHRQGLAFVLTSWLLDMTHWDTRWESLWMVGLLSLSGLLALRLKWKICGSFSFWDIWLPILGLTLTQFETFLITNNASHSIFPLALLLLTANVWLEPKPSPRYLFGGIAAVCLTFTGFGLFGGAMLTGLLGAAALRHALKREWRAAALATAGFGISLGGWIAFGRGYVFNPAVGGFKFPWSPLTDYGRFVALMLLEPAGVQAGAGEVRYFFGCMLGLAGVIGFVVLAFRWLRSAVPNPTLDVLLLLVGSSGLYVCSTAIGRVSLGVEAGMASRYVSLMFPLWLGLFVAAELSGRRWCFIPITLAVWGLALWPYHDLATRKIHRWPGTLGATAGNIEFIENVTTAKAAWVDAYLKTGSWQKPQDDPESVVHPDPSATKLGAKLEFLKQHKLSFFSGRSTADAFLPWLLQDRVVWNHEYPGRNTHHFLGAQGKLTFLSKHSGLFEVLIEQYGIRSRSAELRVEHDGSIQNLAINGKSTTLALPVSAGVTHINFTRIGATEDLDHVTLTIGPVRLKETEERR